MHCCILSSFSFVMPSNLILKVSAEAMEDVHVIDKLTFAPHARIDFSFVQPSCQSVAPTVVDTQKRVLEQPSASGAKHSRTLHANDHIANEHTVWACRQTVNKDYLKDLYPHPRDYDCYMEERTHTYFAHGCAVAYSVSSVWKVFFNDFDASIKASEMISRARESGLRSMSSSLYNL